VKQHSNRTARARRAAVAGAVAALAIAASAPTLANGSATESSAVPTIHIKGSTANSLHFVGPKTIVEGEELRIVNQSNVKSVGPQTFTLVEASEVPKTKKDRELCAKKGHICAAIAGWHGVKGKSAKRNPVEAGSEGWDTEGTLKEKGDSWFTGSKPGASFEQKVNAGATISPITLSFISAFDPSLHGTIKVLPVP
jgi:hypothetical protein